MFLYLNKVFRKYKLLAIKLGKKEMQHMFVLERGKISKR